MAFWLRRKAIGGLGNMCVDSGLRISPSIVWSAAVTTSTNISLPFPSSRPLSPHSLVSIRPQKHAECSWRSIISLIPLKCRIPLTYCVWLGGVWGHRRARRCQRSMHSVSTRRTGLAGSLSLLTIKHTHGMWAAHSPASGTAQQRWDEVGRAKRWLSAPFESPRHHDGLAVVHSPDSYAPTNFRVVVSATHIEVDYVAQWHLLFPSLSLIPCMRLPAVRSEVGVTWGSLVVFYSTSVPS
ncbi:hypothetical protein B0H11DRAFT_1916009 [Mycena galericulata]|nr:hypothetical protein B0H11DRAFT_1916009 [Mycena galericulata]